MADLPPRLSSQQKFILAALASEKRGWRRLQPLSWEVAREFDDEETSRYIDPEEARKPAEHFLEQGADMFDDMAKAHEWAERGKRLHDSSLPDGPRITAKHSPSVSRSIRRLEDRELVDRRTLSVEKTEEGLEWVPERGETTKTTHVVLTDAGERAAEEIQDRVADGRRKLDFDTKPWVE